MSLLQRIFGSHRKHVTSHRCSRTRKNSLGQLESLEGRRMLAGDASVVVGDSNYDGKFDSADMVAVFSSGKFETGQAATFAEGDWNSDGYFNSSDFITAFRAKTYEQPTILAADVPTDGDEEQANGNNIGGEHNEVNDSDGGDVEETGREVEGGHRGRPGHREFRGEGERPSIAERIKSTIEQIQERIDAGGLAENADADAIRAAITAAGEALAAGDLDAAKEALRGIRGDRADADRPDADRPTAEERIQNVINNLQQRIDEGALPEGADADAVQAAIDSANGALANGDLAAAREALATLRGDRRDADGNDRDRGHEDRPDRDDHDIGDRAEGGLAERIDAMRAAILRNMIGRIQQTIENRDLPDGVDVESIRASIADALAALQAGDFDTARDAIRGLLPQRPDADADVENGDDDNGGDNDVNGRERPGRGRPPERLGGRGPRG